jgi:hypothetical protein
VLAPAGGLGQETGPSDLQVSVVRVRRELWNSEYLEKFVFWRNVLD